MKFWVREIEKKILNVSRKIMVTLLGKIEIDITDKLWRNFGKFFWNIFSASVKNYEEIIEKLWKNIENFSFKFLEKDFVKFSKQFLEEFTKNFKETSNNLKINCRQTPKKCWKYFGCSWKSVSDFFKT